jgi:hypothetical protein
MVTRLLLMKLLSLSVMTDTILLSTRIGNNINMSKEIDILKAENDLLHEKIEVMRTVLYEWNATSNPVWEYRKLKQIGETESDYEDLVEDDDGWSAGPNDDLEDDN